MSSWKCIALLSPARRTLNPRLIAVLGLLPLLIVKQVNAADGAHDPFLSSYLSQSQFIVELPANVSHDPDARKDALDKLKDRVQGMGGFVVREMEAIEGLVVTLPQSRPLAFNALNTLSDEFPSVQLSEDILLYPQSDLRGIESSIGIQSAQQRPWGMTAIKSAQANQKSRGAGVRVCVVDSGVDRNHPDLKANLIGGRNFVPSGGRVDPNAWDDRQGHGTHVSGTIAALDNSIGVVGVAPLAKIYTVRSLSGLGPGRLSDVTDGVNECVRVGSHVINMSLGGIGNAQEDSPLRRAIQNAVSKGIVVVAAAGNDAIDIKRFVPSGYPETLAVAAVDSQMKLADFSNFGLRRVDVSAPGVAILSAWPGGKYKAINGTSMAAPHVTGVIALQIASKSKGLLTNDLGHPTHRQGSGIVDAQRTTANRR